MSRFIAVIHGWHVYSNGFSIHELEASIAEEAKKEASWLKSLREDDFDKCAYTVIEIENTEHLSRRLTWRERINGKLN
ncbi:hypothetical protein [Pseudomonas arsenicoxydans]|uniref:Uncharacterized protein n=1 Tax=Pseudomonas arsenicoxydans TaxID=702115 RepID=A0A502HSG5_9PSED|nr:hypothetical protein [Pseudomonas arsenicoxydans]TPG76346.1 hypothetical protein EAH78_18470 [Pseudomonas arsenicoxydans]